MSLLPGSRWRNAGLIALMATFLSACGGSGSSSGELTDKPDENNAHSYSVAVIPDTQKYSRYSPERFMAQTQWIADNYQQQDIEFTLHLGDVVDRARDPQEWVFARQALQVPVSYTHLTLPTKDGV